MAVAGDRQRSVANSTDNRRRSDPSGELERLRDLLFGSERRKLEEIEERFDALELTADEIAELLPKAIALRASEDDALGRALAPTIEAGIKESVYRDPTTIAEAIYPTLGPAIRKAIAQTMAGFVETLNRAIEHSLSWQGLKWRWEAWRSGEPYAQIVIKHALVYRVEQVFLIHAETGLLLAHASVDEAHARDADLVSGMLTAIRDFVNDSFDASDEAGLRSFSVGDRTIFVEAGPTALLAAAIRGQAPAALFERLQGVLETLHLHFHKALIEFGGDNEPFAATQPWLEDCLETVLTTDLGGTRRASARFAWAAAAVVAAVGLFLGGRSWLRWQRAVSALREQPGIVLIEADRGWRRWRFSGLRDPLAPDPSTLLAGLGVANEGIDADWQPYVSLQPPMIVRRAEQILRPPNGVSLSLDGNILRARGTAPPGWLASIAPGAVWIPGVETIDTSAVEAAASPALTTAKQRLEALLVLFDTGSDELTGIAEETFSAAADAVADLHSVATREGWRLRVHLIGRTDSTGTEQANRLLSERRAFVVREELERLGLAPAATTHEGIDYSDPLEAEESGEGAQRNRSVSFIVTLVPESRDRDENAQGEAG